MTSWTLPRSYTIRQLIYAVQHARTHPDDRYLTPDWPHDSLTAAEYLRWFRRCLHRKINRNLTLSVIEATTPGKRSRQSLPRPYGRKDGGDGYLSDYERAALQTARRVNTPRLIVRETEVPFEFRERLRHRLHRREDD